MMVFSVNDTTKHRRQLWAQLNYVKLIQKGVFNHDISKAIQIADRLRVNALLENIAYHFVKNAR